MDGHRIERLEHRDPRGAAVIVGVDHRRQRLHRRRRREEEMRGDVVVDRVPGEGIGRHELALRVDVDRETGLLERLTARGVARRLAILDASARRIERFYAGRRIAQADDEEVALCLDDRRGA